VERDDSGWALRESLSSAREQPERAGARCGRLTAVIPNHNGRRLLQEMLASLERQTLRPGAIVVVDDCSSDDSVAYLAASWPQVRVVRLPARGGVSAALNACLAAARDSELVGLFNNDVELAPSCLSELVAELDGHPEVGSVTPKMLDFADREILDGAGDVLSWRGGGRRRGHGERDVGQYDRAEQVFGPCGGAAVYRRATLEAVGGFDEAYFAYYEDVDWAFRAQLAGFRCRFVPAAVLYHHGSATLGRGFSDFNGYHLWRNPVWLVAKCFPAGTIVRHLPAIARGQLGNLYVAARERKLRVWARAMRDALRGLPGALGKRRAIQRERVLSVAELEAVARLGAR
jgi:GT2 family glycosyltransferase